MQTEIKPNKSIQSDLLLKKGVRITFENYSKESVILLLSSIFVQFLD